MRSTLVAICLLPIASCLFINRADYDAPDKVYRRDPRTGAILQYDVSDSRTVVTRNGVRNVLAIDGVDYNTPDNVLINLGGRTGFRSTGNLVNHGFRTAAYPLSSSLYGTPLRSRYGFGSVANSFISPSGYSRLYY